MSLSSPFMHCRTLHRSIIIVGLHSNVLPKSLYLHWSLSTISFGCVVSGTLSILSRVISQIILYPAHIVSLTSVDGDNKHHNKDGERGLSGQMQWWGWVWRGGWCRHPASSPSLPLPLYPFVMIVFSMYQTCRIHLQSSITFWDSEIKNGTLFNTTSVLCHFEEPKSSTCAWRYFHDFMIQIPCSLAKIRCPKWWYWKVETPTRDSTAFLLNTSYANGLCYIPDLL
jgi:hypothetical protein